MTKTHVKDLEDEAEYHRTLGFVAIAFIVTLIAIIIFMAVMLEKMIDVNSELMDQLDEQHLTQ